MTLIKHTKIMLVALFTLAASFAYAAPSESVCTNPLPRIEAAVAAQGASIEYDIKGPDVARFVDRLKQAVDMGADFYLMTSGIDRIVGYGKPEYPAIKVFYVKDGCVVAGAISDRPTMNRFIASEIEKT